MIEQKCPDKCFLGKAALCADFNITTTGVLYDYVFHLRPEYFLETSNASETLENIFHTNFKFELKFMVYKF